nr:S-antigen protein [Ipomoea batatas]
MLRPSAGAAGSAECGNCGAVERRLPLHDVRHRGNFRKLCTTCVLRLHSQSFCPTCFTVYNPSPPRSSQNDAVTCFKCYSSSHTQCVGPNPPNPYICPLCVTPNSSIFALRKPNGASVDAKIGNGNSNSCRVIDKAAARVLLAAARIAATSMSKAAMAARTEAERRAKEAAFTRKRAREALEHVTHLAAKEKVRRKEVLLVSSQVRPSGGGNVGSVVVNKGDIGRNATPLPVVVKNQRENLERVDTSSEVLAALNAVDLTGNEGLQGFEGHNELAEVQAPDNTVAMDVEENEGLAVAPDNVNGLSIVQNNDGGDENGKSESLAKIEINNGQEVRINSGMVSIPARGDQDQQTRHSLAVEHNKSVLQE